MEAQSEGMKPLTEFHGIIPERSATAIRIVKN
jgi:hypothetical protein